MRHSTAIEAHHFEAMGTSCSLFAVGLSRTRLLQSEFWVRVLGARVTRFSDRSELAQLNRSEGKWVDLSAEMELLLREALRAHELGGGVGSVAMRSSSIPLRQPRLVA